MTTTTTATETTTAATTTPVATPRVFWVDTEVSFKPRKGFETALFNALRDTIRTEAELVTALLESGDYQRVAPKAAELRPTKPTRFLLKMWTAAGVVRTNA